MRLLLVEDHNRFAESIKLGLENEAFAVDTVDSGAAAEAAVASVQYDAIILDLGLPDMGSRQHRAGIDPDRP